ncbi:uncharacterized protein TRUGW13939_01499 [Talaromyces rugulosus]|uniref:Signal recognition particle subunit SRP14 n=1 Tax=Talaromyces rugulosus TaxID=121627 RepID=A0A7H8QMK6_TALRU|nr:uncharacterized protein TRUGW13939_01499 [Talaromyces rugulosus]QKX54413.1 hypothetical protein TRUGW13939_01499 [Talaromyces rugulosus]
MAPHSTNDEFFASLTTLLSTTSQKAKGSVFLTQKRLSFEDPTIAEGSILVRATDGGTQTPNTKPSDKVKKTKSAPKVKISTIVAPADLESFFVRYADVCKAGMVGMKKRDRSAKKKGKAKTKAATKA